MPSLCVPSLCVGPLDLAGFGRHKKIPEQRVTLGALGREISSLDGFAMAVAEGRKLGVALAQCDP